MAKPVKSNVKQVKRLAMFYSRFHWYSTFMSMMSNNIVSTTTSKHIKMVSLKLVYGMGNT